MKLNLSKFHKISSDKDFTILKHEDGHEMKLVHKSLSKGHKKALDALEMNAGAASQSMPMSEGGDPTQKHLIPGDKIPNDIEKHVVGEIKSRMADGGKVAREKPIGDSNNARDPQSGKQIEYDTKAVYQPESQNTVASEAKEEPETDRLQQVAESVKKAFAQGGMPMIHGDKPVHAIKRSNLGEIKRKMYAEGDMAHDTTEDQPSGDQPYGTPPQGMPPQADSPEGMPSGAALPINIPGVTPDQAAPQAAPQAPGKAEVPPPDVEHAYQQAVGANQATAGAEQAQAKRDYRIQVNQFGLQQKFLQDSQENLDALNDEHNSLMQEMVSQKIDPKQYINDKSLPGKISTAIGLILGGIGGGLNGTGRNQALEFLNANIDRDIEGQKANLGKTQSLLAANARHYGNITDAMQATRAQMLGMAQTQLQMSAAKAASPKATANAQALNAKLEQQIAPLYQQMATRKALQTANQANQGGIPQDPASFVPMVVPQDQQKAVFNEIKQAENAKKNHDELMRQFDKAAQENTIARRTAHAFYQPASILSMNALELPMIHDQEGRVNEYEQKTLNDLHPLPGDTDAKVTAKRDAYEAFVLNKSAAPTAKGYGIDLAKFASTTPGKAPEIKVVNGVKFMRGPDGKAVRVP